MSKNEFKNVGIFDDKTFDDLLKEIYDRSKEHKDKIDELIREISPLIKNVNDATLLGPLLADYLEVNVKNDDQLIKLAGVIQRHVKNASDKGAGEEDQPYSISKDELDEIKKSAAKVVNMG